VKANNALHSVDFFYKIKITEVVIILHNLLKLVMSMCIITSLHCAVY